MKQGKSTRRMLACQGAFHPPYYISVTDRWQVFQTTQDSDHTESSMLIETSGSVGVLKSSLLAGYTNWPDLVLVMPELLHLCHMAKRQG